MRVKRYDVELKKSFYSLHEDVLAMMNYYYLFETEDGKTFLSFGEGYSILPISWEDVKISQLIGEEIWEEEV